MRRLAVHIAIRRYSVDPEIYRDLKTRLETDFVPNLRSLDGFVSYYAINTGPDTLDTVSIFETKDGERKSTQLAAEFVKRNYPDTRVERINLDEGPCIVEHHAAVPV